MLFAKGYGARTPALVARAHQLCIVGGGPAGLFAGLRFARAGVDMLVLEKHGDFLRDFRGDTVHPSTRLVRWHRPDLLAIGDAAHAMSPIGGVGINLAI